MQFEIFFQVLGSESRSQGSNNCQTGHILSLSGPLLVHLCMDFKIIFAQVLDPRRRCVI